MIKTRLTELVGLKYPIIQAGMGPYPVTSLCIAAANAGCLGLCSTFATTSRETNPIVFEDFCKQAHAETTDDDVTIFKKMFTRVFEETKESDGIFGANVMVSAEVKANAMKVMHAIKELREADPEMKRRFRVLVTTAGDPMPWANFVKEQGMIWMHVFPGVRTAARCKKAGVQVLIASGHEGGMHTAWQPVHSMTLLPDIIEKFSDENTLVCGTGGFCDGKSIAAAFAMGADGVQMGTRFVTTDECDADPAFKQSYLDATQQDIEIIKSPVGMPGRAIHSSFLDRVKEGLKRPRNCPFDCIKTCDVTHSPYCIMLALYNAFKGKLQNGYAFCGANAWRAEKIQSVRDLMASLKAEYDNFSLKGKLFGVK